jgi:hypothetical protein
LFLTKIGLNWFLNICYLTIITINTIMAQFQSIIINNSQEESMIETNGHIISNKIFGVSRGQKKPEYNSGAAAAFS